MYVERDYRALEARIRAQRPDAKSPGFGELFEEMKRYLSGEYDVDTFLTLNRRIIGLIQKGMDPDRPYEALITHMPSEREKVISGMDSEQAFAAKYGSGLGILREIKEIKPDLFIVAYTGAAYGPNPAMDKVFREEGPVDHIVLKSGSANVREDFEEIKRALEQTWDSC